MKHFLLLTGVCICLALAACSPASVAPATAVPTEALTFTPSPTVAPTATAVPPTATRVPPTPTPAAVGDTVESGIYGITVVEFRKLDTVYSDSSHYWAPKPGYMFIELGVKVSNRKSGSTASVPYRKMIVIQESAAPLSPTWASYKAVETGVEINPKTLGFKIIDNPDEDAAFTQDLYLRLIYAVTKKEPTTSILFTFDGSPTIQILR